MNSFMIQIAMIVLSVGILFTYVKPNFTKIGEVQTAIEQYKEEKSKVLDVNQKLATLADKVNNISTTDHKALLTYMPDTIDPEAVSKDIFTISKLADVYLKSITNSNTGTKSSSVSQDDNSPVPHTFSASVSGTYEQTKLFLSLLEQNNYPLEVYDLKITIQESGLLDTDMDIVTYSSI